MKPTATAAATTTAAAAAAATAAESLAPPMPLLGVHIEFEDEGWQKWPDSRQIIESTTAQVSQYLAEQRLLPMVASPTIELGLDLILGSDAGVQELNRQWRGIDRPTNVLSFPALEAEVFARGFSRPLLPGVFDGHCGDIYLARETMEREARDQQKLFAHHLQHLTIHAILHIFGFDHQAPTEAARMEQVEIELLHRRGIANPYE